MATVNTNDSAAILTPELRASMIQQVAAGTKLTAEEQDGLNTILAALDGYRLVDVNLALIDAITKLLRGESLC